MSHCLKVSTHVLYSWDMLGLLLYYEYVHCTVCTVYFVYIQYIYIYIYSIVFWELKLFEQAYKIATSAICPIRSLNTTDCSLAIWLQTTPLLSFNKLIGNNTISTTSWLSTTPLQQQVNCQQHLSNSKLIGTNTIATVSKLIGTNTIATASWLPKQLLSSLCVWLPNS